MPVTPGPVFPETLYFSITVDGINFPYATSGILKGGANSARSFVCSFFSKEALEMCSIGSIVEVNVGRGNLSNLIDDKKFIGVIKDLEPNEQGSFIAYDFTTFLATSKFIYYKVEDYIGQDLYFAAANACNYKGIDISRLKQGSGIFITKDMNLFGWKTRKEFIDACFNEMKILVNDDRHPTNTIKQWQYAIRSGKVMDFFLPDENNTISQPSITLSLDNKNILNENIISSVDSSRLINAITVVSQSNETNYIQLDDLSSQNRYGVHGYFLQYPSENKNVLEDIGYKLLNRFKSPTVSYSVSITNSDNLDLGDLIEIDMPALPKSSTQSIVEYEIELSETLSMRCKVGLPQLTIKDYIDILQKPTDR
tara:strand:- start:143 stop:1243 length:1101 start_codon:yes stop_codon:yes gene_type:complete